MTPKQREEAAIAGNADHEAESKVFELFLALLESTHGKNAKKARRQERRRRGE